MGKRPAENGVDNNERALEESEDLREIIAAVQQAETNARNCHEKNERQRALLGATPWWGVSEDKASGKHVSDAAISSDDAASLQNGIGSYASSADHDHQRRVAALMEEQQFQNLREKRAVLEEKLHKLSISLRGDGRRAKRARHQVTEKVWNWLNTAYMAQTPSIGVHLGPDHVEKLSGDPPSGPSSICAAGPSSVHGSEIAEIEERSNRVTAGLELGPDQGTRSSGAPPSLGDDVLSQGTARSVQPLASGSVHDQPSPSAAAGSEPTSTAGAGSLAGRLRSQPQQWQPGAAAPESAARFSYDQGLGWLAQAEAARAVLQSSNEVLQASSLKVGQVPEPTKVGSGSGSGHPPPHPSSGVQPPVANGFLSKLSGSTFTMGQSSSGNTSDQKFM